MNNILIVDDEYLARHKLHFLLDWEHYGFQVVAEAANAKEAMDVLESENIDVVFTDVYMPGIDGIRLAEYINKNYPSVAVVIMSNYSDIEYVKRAFSLDIVDYVLKHTVTRESMIALISTLKKRCTSNPDNSAFISKVHDEEEYRKKIMHLVLSESDATITHNVIIALMRINNLDLRMQAFSNEETGILYQNINNTIAQIIKDVEGFVIFETDNNLCIYLPFEENITEVKIMHDIGQYIKQINYSIYKFFNLNLLWGISCPSNAGYSVNQCFKEAYRMIENAPLNSKKSLNTSEPDETTEVNSLSIKQEKDLLAAVSELNKAKVNRILDEIFENIEIHHPSDILLGELITIATKFCSEFNISSDEFRPLTDKTYSQNSYIEWSKAMFSYIIDTHLKNSKQNYHFKYVQSVHEYIAQNYGKNIALKDISSSIGISEQHLSKIYRLQTGKTLSNYLTEYRIERAKELLEKDEVNLKYLYSIVGFNDYNYFFVVFKKYVGCTPNEYKKKLGKK